MHAIRNSLSMKMLSTALVVATFGPGSAAYAQTQSVQFSSEADSDSGTATQTLLGLLPTTQTWGPDDQSETTNSGSNSEPAPSVTENINGVTTYQSQDDDNSTDAGSGADQANATSSSGSGSALGGLITWSNLSIQETCLPDGSIGDQIDCTVYESITNLDVNGKPATTAGSFAPGTSIPVSGNIPDTNCPLGTDSFSGNMVLDNSILDSGTEQGSDAEIAIQITGTATCYTADLVPLYTTGYNEQIGGPDIYYKGTYSLYVVRTWNDYNYY
ncbi:hypothetical protein [Dyella nitratireducens]|uniref:Uncharacterized protein n=1 Tax=Dyella nitratireducens TaxID=1849580 RepID=A0ABQ1GWX0_9GAMM|nr:hypothetical protein [Dyella nitratireducens]GGA52038.1 hypothetical protein GCM10010981_46850 [Dyella nitratireducens]GLQ41624.1 hypothetical protein GCM10007902_14740 [Dyella nitratireducens]